MGARFEYGEDDLAAAAQRELHRGRDALQDRGGAWAAAAVVLELHAIAKERKLAPLARRDEGVVMGRSPADGREWLMGLPPDRGELLANRCILTLEEATPRKGVLVPPRPRRQTWDKVWRPLQCLSRLPPPEDGVTVMLNEALPRSQV